MRERKKIREFERDRQRSEERKSEEKKEARRLREFLEDYDDERDDSKYYRSALSSAAVTTILDSTCYLSPIVFTFLYFLLLFYIFGISFVSLLRFPGS